MDNLTEITTRTELQYCPKCHKILDAHTGFAIPSPGDFTVCLDCFAIMYFGEGLKLILATGEDISKLIKEDPQCYATLMYSRSELMRVAKLTKPTN